MNTMKKHIFSSVLAIAMAASMALPAFAEGEDEGASASKYETKISGLYTEPVINVIVPQTGSATIDPFGIGVQIPTKADASEKKALTGQIYTQPLSIKNIGETKLSVNATVTGSIPEGSTVKFNATSTKGTPDKDESAEDYIAPATGKNVFVQFQMAASKATGGTAETGEEDNDLYDEILTEYTTAATWTKSAENAITVGTKAVTGKALATLNAATMNDTSGKFDQYAAGSIALFRLTGDCVEEPKTPWDATDKFDVTIAFTFGAAK